MNLTDFLLARIAEDEQMARHVWPERFTDRMLAECEAKRRIVVWADQEPYDEQALYFLAVAYADHPDYREEWRP